MPKGHKPNQPADGSRRGAKTVYFQWMGAYWSCTPDRLADLQAATAAGAGFDLYELGCRELLSRPKGKVIQLSDATLRGSE